MKRRTRESGKASLWDFLIVIMIVGILYLGYARGLADHFLAPQYQSTTLLGGKATPDEDAPVTRPGTESNEVAASWGAPAAGGVLKIEPVPGTEPAEAEVDDESAASVTASRPSSRFADPEDEQEGGFAGGTARSNSSDDELPLPTRSGGLEGNSLNPTASEASGEPEAVKLVGLDRRYWPQQVRLLKATVFPVVFNGEEVGSASLPIGTTVALAGISSEEKIVVQNGQASLEVAVADTDLIDRVRVLQRVTGEVTPTPAAAPRSGGWDPRAHNPQSSTR